MHYIKISSLFSKIYKFVLVKVFFISGTFVKSILYNFLPLKDIWKLLHFLISLFSKGYIELGNGYLNKDFILHYPSKFLKNENVILIIYCNLLILQELICKETLLIKIC